ncbi:MAG: (2Fe-2S)-binding protein [Candidatus Aminicenantes bacterium]
MKENIHFKLNGRPLRLTVDGERMLLWVLRSELGLTGVKYGCGEGFCGACTVLVNKEAVRSCQFPVKNAVGKEVLTIESLARNKKLHPLQEAFIKHNALQCGYCTPGMILNAYSLLWKYPQPTTEQIIQAMEGNLCRCGTYSRIIEAIRTASRAMKERRQR